MLLINDVFFELWIYIVVCTLRVINNVRVRTRYTGLFLEREIMWDFGLWIRVDL